MASAASCSFPVMVWITYHIETSLSRPGRLRHPGSDSGPRAFFPSPAPWLFCIRFLSHVRMYTKSMPPCVPLFPRPWHKTTHGLPNVLLYNFRLTRPELCSPDKTGRPAPASRRTARAGSGQTKPFPPVQTACAGSV